MADITVVWVKSSCASMIKWVACILIGSFCYDMMNSGGRALIRLAWNHGGKQCLSRDRMIITS